MTSEAGLELTDLAIFTTFGLASAMLLGVDGPLNGFLAIIYVLTTSLRLCFSPVGEWNSVHRRTVVGIKGQEKLLGAKASAHSWTPLPQEPCACGRLRAVPAEPWAGRHEALLLQQLCLSCNIFVWSLAL